MIRVLLTGVAVTAIGVGLLLAASVTNKIIVERRWRCASRLGASGPEWLNIRHEDLVLLYRRGWRTRHLQALSEFIPESVITRTPGWTDPTHNLLLVAARRYGFVRERGVRRVPLRVPGRNPDEQLLWIRLLVDPESANVQGFVKDLTKPGEHIHYAEALPMVQQWHDEFGILAPIALSAGLSVKEIRAAVRNKRVDLDSLMVLAALRGVTLPAVSRRSRLQSLVSAR